VKIKLTQDETNAINAVFAAIRALPKSLYIDIARDDQTLTVWKRRKQQPDEYFTEADSVRTLRCKGKVAS
jgi:hypothetical protein